MKRWESSITPQLSACSICSENHPIEKCQILTEVKHIADNNPPTLARLSIPSTLSVRDTLDGIGIVAKAPLCRGTQFGPFKAELIDTPPPSGFILQIFHDNDKPGLFLETNNEHKCNWMCLVAAAENSSEQNLVAYQVDQKIYFSVMKSIDAGVELKVWYAPFYAAKLNKSLLPPGESEEDLQSAIEDYNNTPKNLRKKSKLKHHSIPTSDPLVNDLTPEQLGAKVSKDQWLCKRCTAVETTVPAYARHLMVHLQEDIKLALRIEKNNNQQESSNNGAYSLVKLSPGESLSNGIAQVSGKVFELPSNLPINLPLVKNLQSKNENSVEKSVFSCGSFNKNLPQAQSNALDFKSDSSNPLSNNFVNEAKSARYKQIESSNTLDSVNILDFDDLNISNLEKTGSFNNLFTLDSDLFMNYSSEESQNSSTKKETLSTDQVNCAKKLDKLDFDFSCKSSSSLIDLNCSNLEYLINDIPLMKDIKKEDSADNLNLDLSGSHFNNILDRRKPVVLASSKNHFLETKNGTNISFSNCIPNTKSMNMLSQATPSSLFSAPTSALDVIDTFVPSLNQNISSQFRTVAIPASAKSAKMDLVENETIVSDYTCEICMHEFKNARYLFRHLRLHLGEFTCTKCFRAFSRKQTLDDHFCKLYICKKCDQKFVFVSHFQKHEKWHLKTERLEETKKRKEKLVRSGFMCDICNCKFSSESRLRKHCRKMHVVDTRKDEELSKKNCICPICGCAFLHLTSLNAHLQKHGDPEFECHICDKRFHRKDVLKKHIFQVHGPIRFHCIQCPSVFTTEHAYNLHLKSIHSKTSPFKCKVCGKVLNRKKNLEIHEKSHSKINFPCGECSRTFSTEQGREKHQKIHLKRKNFTCSQCSQIFIGKMKLKLHYEEVHRNHPYTCSFCFLSTKTVTNLKKHLKFKHKDKVKEWDVPGYFDFLKSSIGDKNKVQKEASILREAEDSSAHADLNASNNLATFGPLCHNNVIGYEQCAALKTSASEVPCGSIGLNNIVEPSQPFNSDDTVGLSNPVSLNFDADNSLGLGIFGSEMNGCVDKRDKIIFENSRVLPSAHQFQLSGRSGEGEVMIGEDKLSSQSFSTPKEPLIHDSGKSDVLSVMIDGSQLYANPILDNGVLSLNSLGGEILWTVSDLPGISCNQNAIQSLPITEADISSEPASTNPNMLLYVFEPSTTEISSSGSEMVLF